MSEKPKTLWLYFTAGFIFTIGYHTAEVADKAPYLSEDLAHHCVERPHFHPDCVTHGLQKNDTVPAIDLHTFDSPQK